MSFAPASYRSLVSRIEALLARRRTTIWVGESLSSGPHPAAEWFLNRVALLTRFALEPHVDPLPSHGQLLAALEARGFALASMLADRTIGRIRPLALEETFDGARPRLDGWSAMLRSIDAGPPGFCHRAVVALVSSGYVHRLVTANPGEQLEQAARDAGLELRVVRSLEDVAHTRLTVAPYLIKLHGTTSRPGSWPLDLNRLDQTRKSALLSAVDDLCEHSPILLLGYQGPDPFDLGPLFRRARFKEVIWAEERNQPFNIFRYNAERGSYPRANDFADSILHSTGGWRVRGHLRLLLEDLCARLRVEVPGPPLDEEKTRIQTLDDPILLSGRLPADMEALGQALRRQWTGAFALLNALGLWTETALNKVSARRKSLEATLPDPPSRAWLRYLIGQTARRDVEAAFLRHFHGLPAPPLDDEAVHRLERSAEALDTLEKPELGEPLYLEELRLERAEVGFALTGSKRYLPEASQVIAELPSVTHRERWLRLQAAGAVKRRQWSVAVRELSKALSEGISSNSPTVGLRARVSLAAVLGQIVELEDDTKLLGALKALERQDRSLLDSPPDLGTSAFVTGSLVLQLYEMAIDLYDGYLPTLEPPLLPLLEFYIRAVLRAHGDQAEEYIFDPKSGAGRLILFSPAVEQHLENFFAERNPTRPPKQAQGGRQAKIR